MKIFYDHQIFSYQTYGGISRYFFELMNQFQQLRGPDFQLALKYSDNVYLKSLKGAAVEQLPSVLKPGSKLRFLATYLLNKRLSSRSLRRGDFDVFHPTFFDPSFLSLLKGRPFVVTLHDMTPEIFPVLFPRYGLYGRLVTGRWIEGMRLLAERASNVIAVSENTKSDAVKYYGIDPSRVTVIHHGSSLDPLAYAEVKGVDMARPFLLFVGGRSGYKNFQFLVRALIPLMEWDRDLRVVCIGGGNFSGDETKQLEDLQVRDKYLQFSATDAELATLYRAARAFVFPSRYEGFGIPIIEAFSCGCPCAISRSSCFPEIAGGAAAYFDPDNLESMTETLRQVLYDDGLRRKLIADGFERAKLFSWEKTATQTLTVYKGACAGRPMGAWS